jgi:hypothetical protein
MEQKPFSIPHLFPEPGDKNDLNPRKILFSEHFIDNSNTDRMNTVLDETF